ncbi:hypothetical protein PSAB6_460009 [Paraburkholderia sabiae]|uniref:hypothetical protein n=1 Tax=Paraburkholderia sabiae TaxID=273251 RepID=UPI001CAD27FB|nr:hypothetical protein [Paraburkholderia sabiae]CAG9226164.1 hypothetical protein PSAB6_460009 [Paraburkholderia sabiae]
MIDNPLTSPVDDSPHLRLDCGITATVDHHHGMVWLANGEGFEVGLSLFDEIEGTHFDDALGLTSSGTAGFIEFPCSEEQAKQLFRLAGWSPSRLEMY